MGDAVTTASATLKGRGYNRAFSLHFLCNPLVQHTDSPTQVPRVFPLISLRSDARQPPILNAEVVPPSRRPFYEAEVEVVNHNILRKNGDLGSLVEVEIIEDSYDHKRLPAASVVVRKQPRDWTLQLSSCVSVFYRFQ